MSLLTAGEVLQFAVRIEERGMDFYTRCAQRFSGSDVAETFAMLAQDEARHRETFEGMLQNTRSAGQPTGYPDEYFAYLQAYTEGLIFTGKTGEELDAVADARSAVDFGIRREADSILYYQELKSFVPRDDQPLVDRILEEERRHFSRLSELRKSMQG
ncbi:MAG: ferritin-like domain-containing protein [Spirochaetota bacterium]